MNIRKTDVLILGSGLSGLMTAQLISSQKNVIVLTKNRLEDSNSYLAQGGIAAALQPDDSSSSHFFDTVQAGCNHNDLEKTKTLVREGPAVIRQLIDFGVKFDQNLTGTFEFGREGAHSLSRILHAGGDSTGKHVIEALKKQAKTEVVERETAVQLIVKNGRCVGAWSLDESGELTANLASAVVVATGGYSGLYPLHSNASTITGDGIALAYEAGASVSDMEFIQFHPTLLVKDGIAHGLVSEAVRGKGAVLVDENGIPLMDGEHPQKDLAPRDVVSRVLYRARQSGRKTYLDIRSVPDFAQHFPTITKLCETSGIPIEKGRIPVSPGAHFTMGGIEVDQWGRSTLHGLYAVGEAANTGVHGANRLASNSLLEGLVFANRLSRYLLTQSRQRLPSTVEWSGMDVLTQALSFTEIRETMNKHVGIERNGDGLAEVAQWFDRLLKQTDRVDMPSLEQIQKRNQVIVAWLTANSALQRTESRGSHYRTDFPNEDDIHWKQRRIKRRKLEHEPIESSSGA